MCASSVRERAATSIPSRRYDPFVGVSRHPRMLSKVDFPEPDAPMIATNSPVSMRSDTPSSACTGSSPSA